MTSRNNIDNNISNLLALRVELNNITQKFASACINADAALLIEALDTLDDYWIRCIQSSERSFIDISTKEVRQTLTNYREFVKKLFDDKKIAANDITRMADQLGCYELRYLITGSHNDEARLKLDEEVALYEARLHQFIANGSKDHHTIHLSDRAPDKAMRLAGAALEFFAEIPLGYVQLSKIGFMKSFLKVLPAKKGCTLTALSPKLAALIKQNQDLVLNVAYHSCDLDPEGNPIPKKYGHKRPSHEHFSVWFLSELHRNSMTDLAHDLIAVDYEIDEEQSNAVNTNCSHEECSYRLLSLMYDVGLGQTAAKTVVKNLYAPNKAWANRESKHDLMSCVVYHIEVSEVNQAQALSVIDRCVTAFIEYPGSYTPGLTRMLAEQIALLKQGELHPDHRSRLEYALDSCSQVFAMDRYANEYLNRYPSLKEIITGSANYKRIKVSADFDI
ncbi:hypothetical protein P5704_026775 (plasmid) [Pseudomonas sp. FeN3W]|nr:hypothetical protein P5704_026775 [Pseudomonas sp. FeN3W]